MGRQKPDLDHEFDDEFDQELDDFEGFEDGATDIDELVVSIHRADWPDKQGGRRRYRSARRRVDDLAQERLLKEELLDWYEYGATEESSRAR
jgi:hypothetical protein